MYISHIAVSGYGTTQQVKNEKKSNEVVQAKTHIGYTTPTRTTNESAKSPPTKERLDKSPIPPPKSDKAKKPEHLKQKPQIPIG